MSEETRKKVAKLFMEGKGYQNDANVETIKRWVELYYPSEKKEEPKPEPKKKKEVKK